MRPVAPALLALLLACAGEKLARRPAHAATPRLEGADAVGQATGALAGKGYQMALADPVRGVVITRPLELQAPCGASTCLARQTIYLRVASGKATLSVDREHWDSSARRWAQPDDPPSIEALERDEAALLQELFGAVEVELRRSVAGEPCGRENECQRGLACLARRCWTPCDGGGCPEGARCLPAAGGRQVCVRAGETPPS